MKKVLFLAAMLISAVSFGQNNFTYSGATHDTLTNSNTVYAYAGTAGIVGAVENLSLYFTPTKITGITVGGYAILQVSNDGTNYSDRYGTSADTLTIANTASTQNLKWAVGGADFKYWRIKIVGNQTQTVKLTGKYFVRNK